MSMVKHPELAMREGQMVAAGLVVLYTSVCDNVMMEGHATVGASPVLLCCRQELWPWADPVVLQNLLD